MVSLLERSAAPAAEPDAGPKMPHSTSNATRHLSAGAYIDNEFSLEALREVYFQPRRIVAPAYGFDAVTVLGHCLRARRAMLVRDVILLSLLVFASWLSAISVLVVLATLLVFHIGSAALVVGRESLVRLRESMRVTAGPGFEERSWSGRTRAPADRHQRVPVFSRGFVGLWLDSVLVALIARVLGIVATYATFGSVSAAASIWLWHTDPWADAISGRVVAGLIGIAFLVPASHRVWNRLQVRALVPGRRAYQPIMTDRLRRVARQMCGNTVVYSGHRPFVGSGEVLRRWDLAQRLVRNEPFVLGGQNRQPKADGGRGEARRPAGPERDREFPTPPFTAQQISDYVRDQLRGIAQDDKPERNLPNLKVVDQIFVAGTEISDLTTETSHERVADIIRYPTAPQRHYLSCQVVSWRGELVTTVYVHFAVQGKVLYVELYVTGLLPCDARFRVVDEIGGTGVKAVLRDAARAMRSAPMLLAGAPANLWRALFDQLSLVSARATGRLHKGYDYGARTGLREIGASSISPDHMQTQDIVKYGRVIERRVLAAILDFLETHEVDITEYRHRSMTILNAGAVATDGGTVNVQGDAIGAQTNTQGGDD